MARTVRTRMLLAMVVIFGFVPVAAFALCPQHAEAAEAGSPATCLVAVQADVWDIVEAEAEEPVQKVFYVNSAKTQAIALSGYASDAGYDNGSVWFVKGPECRRIYTSERALYGWTAKMLKVKGGKMLIVDEGAGGSSWSASRVFFIANGKAKRVSFLGSDLKQVKNNQFTAANDAYDMSRLGGGTFVGCSHKPYYYKWTGKRFVEYGGKAVTKKQLKKAKNGAKILRAVAKKGKIGKIWYRANGIVNINYSEKQGSETRYHNLTLKLKGKTLSYYGKNPYDLGFGGSYKKRGGGVKVNYPKQLPSVLR